MLETPKTLSTYEVTMIKDVTMGNQQETIRFDQDPTRFDQDLT